MVLLQSLAAWRDDTKVNVGNHIPTLGISWYLQIIRFLMPLVKTLVGFPCETQRSSAKHKGLFVNLLIFKNLCSPELVVKQVFC